MKVCDISVHAFLSVGSCDSSSGFSLALISFFLGSWMGYLVVFGRWINE